MGSPDTTVTIQILLSGLKRTKPDVIKRELTFKQGEQISLRQLKAELPVNRNNIYNLGLFNEVQIRSQVIEQNVWVIIDVKERWFVIGSPILDFEERNSYDMIDALRRRSLKRVVYGGRLNWRNVTGQNETLSLGAQWGFSKRLRASFYRPAIFPSKKIDFVVGGKVFWEQEIIMGIDSGIVQWRSLETETLRATYQGEIGLVKRFTPRRQFMAQLSYRHFVFSDSLYDFRVDGERFNHLTRSDARESYPSIILTYAHDNRDLKSFPLKGLKYQLLMRLAGNPDPEETQFWRVGFTWAHHMPVKRKWNFTYGLHSFYTLGRTLPFYEKNFVGIERREFPGISSQLRGYEPYAITGTWVNMVKAELKFALIPYQQIKVQQIPLPKFNEGPIGAYLTAFIDQGYVEDQSNSRRDDFLQKEWLRGYGVGLNLIGFYDTLLRIELSRNHLGQSGINFHGTLQIK
ncbi:MAG: BamA/TamA family outer membrane protein [Bacteroidota bacterium]